VDHVPATVTTLSNGLRVVTQATDSPGTHIEIHVDAGSRSNAIQGAANFLHNLSISDPKLNSNLENIGSALDAEIGVDNQSYATVVPTGSDVPNAIKMLGQAITAPSTDQGIFKQVQSDILFNLDNDPRTTEEVIRERLRMSCWRDGDLGFSLFGTHGSIEQMTPAMLKEQLKIQSSPKRIVVSAAGNVNHAEIVKAAEAQFGKLVESVPIITATKPYFLGSELIYRDDEMGPTAFFSVGYRGIPVRHEYRPAFELMRQLVGQYDKFEWLVPHKVSGNRCREGISNKMNVGCADVYRTFNHCYRDTGMLGWYVECDEVAVSGAVDEMMFGFNHLSHSVTEEEIDRAKRELMIEHGQNHEDSSKLAKLNAKNMAQLDRVVPWVEWYHRIMSLNASEINHVAFERLHDEEVVVSALGPLHGHEVFFNVRRQNMMYRYGY